MGHTKLGVMSVHILVSYTSFFTQNPGSFIIIIIHMQMPYKSCVHDDELTRICIGWDTHTSMQ